MSLTFCLLILVWNMSCTGKYDLKLNQMNINANVIKHYPDWWRTRVKTETLKVDEHTKQKIIQDRWPLTPDDLLQCLPVILMMLWICLFFHLKAVFLCMMYWNVHLLIGFFIFYSNTFLTLPTEFVHRILYFPHLSCGSSWRMRLLVFYHSDRFTAKPWEYFL